jgi:hypothetical protein
VGRALVVYVASAFDFDFDCPFEPMVLEAEASRGFEAGETHA